LISAVFMSFHTPALVFYHPAPSLLALRTTLKFCPSRAFLGLRSNTAIARA
jgi:hypothetical protein